MRLRLLIADDGGNLYEVLDGLEEYDLTKPIARLDVSDQIADTVRYILLHRKEQE